MLALLKESAILGRGYIFDNYERIGFKPKILIESLF